MTSVFYVPPGAKKNMEKQLEQLTSDCCAASNDDELGRGHRTNRLPHSEEDDHEVRASCCVSLLKLSLPPVNVDDMEAENMNS